MRLHRGLSLNLSPGMMTFTGHPCWTPVLGPVELRAPGGQFVLRGLILQNSCLRSGLRSVQGDQGEEERAERVAGADSRADVALS